jgi:hypothetical protein
LLHRPLGRLLHRSLDQVGRPIRSIARDRRHEGPDPAQALRIGNRRAEDAEGGAIFSYGFIERFGTEPEPKQFCHAKQVDADTIEITLPAWGLEQDV